MGYCYLKLPNRGAPDLDGKGPSVWDHFGHTEGNIKNGDTGDIACDHYHLWPEDLKLLKNLRLTLIAFL